VVDSGAVLLGFLFHDAGLAQSGRQDLVQDMISDFAWLIDRYGHVRTGTRTYIWAARNPFFFEMVAAVASARPGCGLGALSAATAPRVRLLDVGAAALPASTARRRVVRLPDGAVLNRYWDDIEQPRDESWREDTALARSSGRKSQQLYRDIRAAAESGGTSVHAGCATTVAGFH